jgi:hypothetical protein
MTDPRVAAGKVARSQAPLGRGAPCRATGQRRLRGLSRARGRQDRQEVRAPAEALHAAETPQGKINTADPDSRNVKTPRGWVHGYNAQAATTERQIVIAAELINSSADFGHIGPTVDAARRELLAAGVTEAPRVVLADAGYWHTEQMQALAVEGVQVLIPLDADKRKGTRPGWNGGPYAFMRRVLQTPTGAALYGKRQGMIEPVFAHTKFNRRIDRFQRRGRAACRSEWRLITATHNLLKLDQHALSAVAV